MSLGETLRLAREEKGQTVSQVAEATRMMVQIVEDLEREDFRRIAAPIYGRGFIKLYAEYLARDPEPLIREFMEIYTGSRPPQVVRRAAEVPSDSETVGPSDGRTVAPSGAPTVQPPDRPTVPPSDSLTDKATGEPDLFSVAAGRSEAVRSVADPAQPGESAPPRVRPASTRAETRPPVSGDPAVPRRDPPKPRERLLAETPPVSGKTGDWLPPQWTPAVIGTVAAIVLLLLVLGVVALRRKGKAHRASKAPAVKVERVLPPAAPYFD